MLTIRCSRSLSGDCTLIQKAAEATGSYFRGHWILWSGSTLWCYPSIAYLPTSLQGGLIILEWQVQLIQNEDKQHNIYSVKIILTPTTHALWFWTQLVLKTCRGHPGFSGWMIHRSCTQLSLLFRCCQHQRQPGQQLTAADTSPGKQRRAH